MTFHRKKDPIVFHYQKEGTSIERVFVIRILELLYDVQLSFVQHIELNYSAAISMLGFIMRVCLKFPLLLKC